MIQEKNIKLYKHFEFFEFTLRHNFLESLENLLDNAYYDLSLSTAR